MREDTDAARFQRLLDNAEHNAEELGWVEVLDPDADFEGIGFGALVHWECDIYVPDSLRALSVQSGTVDTLAKMEAMLPAARNLGLDTSGIPDVESIRAMSTLLTEADVPLAVVGEDDDTGWRVCGTVFGDVSVDDLEGRVRIIGKVSTVVREGRWKSIASLPGMNLLSREDRRRIERSGPRPGEEDRFLKGPALVLDLLAIYR